MKNLLKEYFNARRTDEYLANPALSANTVRVATAAAGRYRSLESVWRIRSRTIDEQIPAGFTIAVGLVLGTVFVRKDVTRNPVIRQAARRLRDIRWMQAQHAESVEADYVAAAEEMLFEQSAGLGAIATKLVGPPGQFRDLRKGFLIGLALLLNAAKTSQDVKA